MTDQKTTYDKLPDIIEFIEKTHTHLNAKGGLYCLKLWRQPNGRRVPIEELRGVRIKTFSIYDKNTLIIQQISHGTAFKGNFVHAFEATTYLPDLAMINVYDYAAEFWTTMGLDFTYIQQTKESKTVMLAEWIHDVPRILRAQWFKDDEMEDLLSDVGVGMKIRHYKPMGRNLDLSGEDI